MDPRVEEKFKAIFGMEAFQKNFKSLEQGAATTVLAAIGRDFEGKGGLYLDDCGVSPRIGDDEQAGLGGWKSWAFDGEGAKVLWRDSLGMVGVEEEGA